MSEDELSNHVLYVSGQQNNQGNKTGSSAVVQILKSAGLIEESNGKLVVSKPQQETIPEPLSVPETKIKVENQSNNHNNNADEKSLPSVTNLSGIPQIAINIQLQLPATDDASIYEKLFKALREQLINPKDS